MKKALNITLLLLLVPLLGWANMVTFDNEPLWATYGAGTHLPGEFIFSEDLAGVFVDEFFSSGIPYYTSARIEPATADFGNNQTIQINNVTLTIDFTADGDVTFEFLDMGGSVNLQVNGFGSVLEAPDMAMLAGVVAPGINMNVAVVAVAGGGHRGTAILTGPVHTLRVGGQEFWLDGMDCHNGVSAGLSGCDYLVDHESLGVGTIWDSSTVSPGDWIFNEDGIDVTIHELDWGTGGYGFNSCSVMVPGVVDFGFNQAMNLNNVSNKYRINALGIFVAGVTFEFLDYGGMENLQVNGATLHIGDLETFPFNVAPGVTMTVATYPVGPAIRAEVTLTGDVQELLVGGQEFFIDEICVIEGDPTILECDHLVDHESLGLGDKWGAGSGHGPGDLAFVEDGIPVYLGMLDGATGMFFDECEVQPALSGMGDGNVMSMINICNIYEIAAVDAMVAEVTFEFLTLGGLENLQVNGAPLFIGDIEMAPAAIAPGVTYTLVTYPVAGGLRGEARLVGEVKELVLGGQELWVDNICVKLNTSTGVNPQPMRSRLELKPNYPNPFNPKTTLSFSLERGAGVKLTIHDAAGRLVKTLITERRSSGDHRVTWDGRNDRGAVVAAGMYIVRLAADTGEVKTQKIGLIK